MKKTFSEINFNTNIIRGANSSRIFKSQSLLKLANFFLYSKFIIFKPLKMLIKNVNHYKQITGSINISKETRFLSLQYLDYFVNFGEVPLEKALSYYFDTESKENVKKLLRNWKLCATNNFIKKDLIFTKEDLLKISQQKLKVENGKKENQNFLFFENLIFHKPMSFLPEIFIEKCGINFIENKNFIKSETHIIDCGAYVGDSSIVLADIFKNVKIIAIEMVPENVKQLKKNIELNNLSKRIYIFNNAVGDKKKKIQFSGTNITANKNVVGERIIYQTTIDEIVKEKKVSIIKMDIEGAELLALKGAEKTIKQDKPILLISIYHEPRHLIEIPEYIKSICSDYKFKIRHLKPEGPCTEYMLICEV